MMNGMNGQGYSFPAPTVTDTIEALNCYGCGMEQVQGMLRIAADEAQSFAERDFGAWSSADQERAYDLWMLIEGARAREEALDALFHAAESHLLKVGYVPASQRDRIVTATAWAAVLAAYRDTVEGTNTIATAAPDNDTAIDAATDTQTKALEELLHHRAPDHDALLEKLRIIDKEGYHNNSLAWTSIIGDVEVLGGGIES